MQDTPSGVPSQHKSYLFCYQKKFATGKGRLLIRRHLSPQDEGSGVQ